MRIGIDCRLWNETGIGRYIRNLVINLAEIDTYNNEYILFLRKNEYDTLVTPGNNFRKRLADIHWHSVAEQTSFLKMLYKERLDLVHFPYFSYPILYARPFVITIHDLILFHYPTGKASQLPSFMYQTKLFAYKQLMRHAARYAKKIIAVSNATKEEIITQLHAKPENIVVTYEGIMDGLPKAMGNLHTPSANPYFLYVGNAYPHKNLDKLLKSYADFCKEIKQVDLVLVGKQDYFYEELKRKLFTFGIEGSVRIMENVSDAELVFLYRYAIALVMPSLMEGFGLPTVEAMANNCLVMASNIPSLKEICQDAAIYFDPLERKDIVRALREVYFGRSTFTKNKTIGFERAKLFSWKKMAQETLKIYSSVPSSVALHGVNNIKERERK